MRALIAAVACSIAMGGAAHAGAVFAFEERSDGVFGVLSGSLDISNAVLLEQGFSYGSFASDGLLAPASGFLISYGAENDTLDFYQIDGRERYGDGDFSIPKDGNPSGDAFSVDGIAQLPAVGLPAGYVSGTELNATMSYLGETFSSLEITPGIYDIELVQELVQPAGVPLQSSFVANGASPTSITLSFTIVDDPEVIPLPAGLPLLIAALGGLALLRRRA